MFRQPLTFLADFKAATDKMRPYIMQEFAANGAKHLVLSNSLILQIMSDWSLMKTLQNEMSANGLSFADAHSPYGSVLDMNCPDPDFRPQMILRHKMAIRIAAAMGVDTITIHPGSDRFFPEVPLEKHFDLMRDSLDQLLPEAEACKVILCIENSMSRAARPDAVIMLKSEYPTEYLGLCYDSGHANQLDNGRLTPGGTIWKFWQTVGVDEPEWDDRIIEKMLPEIVNCHLHDNDGSDDSHNIPGEGNADWQKIVRLLKQAPRLRVIQSEVKMFPRYSIKTVCDKFAEIARIGD